jgi:hypothetical protein
MFPIEQQGGRVATLGVQDVHATHEELARIMHTMNVRIKEVPLDERRYTHSKIVERRARRAHIADVFRMLGYDTVDTIDFSDAESPDILHNLSDPVPEDLHEKYDLVFDIGVVEHVCDIFQALCNCMTMVKPGGTVVHIVPLHGWHNMTYFNFQPMFFHEVYAANGFEPTRTYINFYPQFDEWNDRPMLYREYQYGDEMLFQLPRKLTNICFFARKTRSIKDFVKPIQGFYLRYHGEDATAEPFLEQHDGRYAARLKRQLPAWLVQPLLSVNRFRLRLEDAMLPYAAREWLYCYRRRRHILALDRVRRRNVFWI